MFMCDGLASNGDLSEVASTTTVVGFEVTAMEGSGWGLGSGIATPGGGEFYWTGVGKGDDCPLPPLLIGFTPENGR